MAQKLDPKEIVTLEELAHSNYFQIETILRLLVKKGIITKQEYIDEMKELKKEMAAQGTVE
jgi:mannitol/fructose-specific phosphotransferase system IIA component (Ntr-type)